jgi:C-methyltransferase
MTTTSPAPSAVATPAVQAAPNELVWALSEAVVASRALHLVAELGVADHLGDEPATATALAERCDLDTDALDRVLRLLCAQGIFRLEGSRYTHTDASRLLRSDHPMSMRDFARLNSLPVVWGALAALDRSARTGTPGAQAMHPDGFFVYLSEHPEEAEIFGHAMAAKARADIADILAAFDFSRFRTIADIGGGRGHLLQAVLESAPHAQGVLFDLPEVIHTFEIHSERITTRAGDFFVDPLPEADAYLLMEVIHDWADPEASAIVGAIRRACKSGATVLILEHIAPETGVDPVSQTLDVLMLAVTGGRERTATQLGHLLEKNGFRQIGVTTTAGAIAIVEGIAR